MKHWSDSAPLTFLAHGGWILLAAAALAHWGLPAPAHAFLVPFESLVAGAALLLAWRFHSTRAFFALLVILLAQRATFFFTPAHAPASGSGLFAVHAVELLLPLNFVLLALIEESGFAVPSLIPFFALLLAQSIGVAAFSRIATNKLSGLAGVPVSADVAFALVGVVLLLRWILAAKPLEGALFWALAACFLALQSGGLTRASTIYFAAAALILAVALVETGYRLAYHDELTGLPARRAFQDAMRHLEAPYTIAAVDIDHFKKFNDTYGHATGDEVLRLVAARLARVGGGGTAYRCGGEEFNILFPGKLAAEVFDEVERLRARIESASFRLRSADRRKLPREADPDRRGPARGRRQTGRAIRRLAKSPGSDPLSVTVSIGVASARKGHDPDAVLRAADQALYRAKGAGRNRVETASSLDRRARTASIA